MFRLTMMIRLILWLLWMGTYVVTAMWVGEGLWDQNYTRFFAASFGLGWALIGGLCIEDGDEPAKLAKRLMDDVL